MEAVPTWVLPECSSLFCVHLIHGLAGEEVFEKQSTLPFEDDSWKQYLLLLSSLPGAATALAALGDALRQRKRYGPAQLW